MEFGFWSLERYVAILFVEPPVAQFWILEFGFWILDFGFWILEFGFWILDFGFWILDFGFRILDFGFWILDFGFRILDFGFRILDFGFWSLDFGFWILDFGALCSNSFCADFGFWILDFGFWISDFGFWILDFGFWILDFGFRILDFGFWILDFGFRSLDFGLDFVTRFGPYIRLEYWSRRPGSADLKSGRHEVVEFANMPYDSFLGEMARKQAKGKPPILVGVLCGAFVSPEMASRMQDLSQEGCPWCQCTEATFNHVCWECVQFRAEKPQTPDNAITKRLGWGDESVLSHLGFRRQAVLKLRWD